MSKLAAELSGGRSLQLGRGGLSAQLPALTKRAGT